MFLCSALPHILVDRFEDRLFSLGIPELLSMFHRAEERLPFVKSHTPDLSGSNTDESKMRRISFVAGPFVLLLASAYASLSVSVCELSTWRHRHRK